jgi:15,16-dihydrobiliverdin:ferredoxin oxidoreductase
MSVLNRGIVYLSLAASLATAYVATHPSQMLGVRRSISSSPFRAQIESSIDNEFEQVALYKNPTDIRQAESQHQMPWKQSIDPKAFVDEELLYMPFWNYQMKFLEENLTDLKVVACTNGITDFTYNENASKKARIVNLCLSSKEYRKIRLTYYDAGDNTQVFNAVLYPRSNLPILGVDLLAFNRKKYLAIVDFQPLHSDESDHEKEFSHLLQPIKETYPSLKGRMSSKFYDETKFFSQQMLFSRFEDESIIQNELFPAFKQYVSTHLELVRSVEEDQADAQVVLQHQQAYDTYSAARDPATGLFTAMFGEEWAMDYVHDFLFSMSERPEPVVAMESATSQQPTTPVASKNPYAASAHARETAFTASNSNPYVSQRQPQLASVSI